MYDWLLVKTLIHIDNNNKIFVLSHDYFKITETKIQELCKATGFNYETINNIGILGGFQYDCDTSNDPELEKYSPIYLVSAFKINKDDTNLKTSYEDITEICNEYQKYIGCLNEKRK